MSDSIDRYLTRYIHRRRAVALIAAIGWAAAFAIAWLLACIFLNRRFSPTFHVRRIECAAQLLMVLAILTRPAISLFRRRNRVAAAIEIEKSQPAFNERLITVASPQADVALLAHLRLEVMQLIGDFQTSARVSVRPLLLPIGLIVALVLAAITVARVKSIDLPRAIRVLWSVQNSGEAAG
jgi:hypothetical protein